jgi:hypothetical protein
MKNILLTLGIGLVSLGSFAQNFSWAQGWGGDSYDHSYSVATDDSGYIYTAGMFQGTVDFDPGPETYIITSQNVDGFIMKTSPTGDLVWAQKIGGSGNNDVALSIAIGANNDIYISGSFSGTVDFDNGPGVATLTSVNFGYLLRLTSNGNFVWVKQTGAPGKYIALDNNNNIYTTGNFTTVADFDPSSTTYTLDGTPSAIFICKLDSSGNFNWAKHFTVPDDSITITSQCLAIDGAGNVYSTGNFESTVDFDPGAGTATLTPENYDGYFLKLDVNGNFVWVKHLEQFDTAIPYGDGYTVGNSITLDPSDNIYLTGMFSGVVDFDPGIGVDTLNSGIWVSALHYYYASMFLAKYDSDGNYIWAKSILGNYDVTGSDIALNADGEIYTTGYFSGTVDFDPSAGVYSITNYNGQNIGNDIFVAKYDQQGDLLWAQGIGGTNHDRGYSLALDASENVYVTGIFQNTVDFDAGPGVWNLITNNLSAETPNAFLLKLSECVPPRDTVDITTCENQYSWSVNGFTYNRTGTYTHISAGAGGCDSLVTLELSIPIFANQPTYSNHTLLANPDQPADTYQWYDCNTPERIFGATQSSFSPVHNADYALIISNQGCIDTSACVAVVNMSVNEYNKENISLFPNPTQDELHIQSSSPGSLSIQVMDVNGKEIYHANKIANGGIISTKDWNPGVYFIRANTEQSKQVYRIIKL